MVKDELKDRYTEIEKKILPVKVFLEDHKNEKHYKDLYKGISTLLSPLVYEPEILFMGINSGDGAYKEMNPKTDTNETPLRMIGNDERFLNKNNLFERGTAQIAGEYLFIKGERKWVNYEWFERDKKVNNRFPKQMIDLLYNVAEKKYPEYEVLKNQEPPWKEVFANRIMYTNLYPIITTNTGHLSKIHSQLAKEPSLKHFWGAKGKVNNWKVRLYFVHRSVELVNLVKPKVIVCMGVAAFNDFTFSKEKKEEKVFFKKCWGYPVIGFSREGNWSSIIPEIASMIVDKGISN